jgi:hypothetical protein
MIRVLAIAGLAVLVASPSFAASSVCSSAPASKFQPKTKLESMLKGAGMRVKLIKTEKGCYEVYAVDKAGKKVNVAYNAETLKKVANPEAGEQ